jgi:signal transduction histidine kinase/ActR/RegA family two-component response regulator
MHRTVHSLIQDAPSLTPDTPGAAVYDLFSHDPELVVCAVVDGERPVGLVSRNSFFLKMADTHGRALYSRRPVTYVMQADPLVVESGAPLGDLSREILEGRASAMFEGFIVTREGAYAGVGSGLDLLRLLHAEAEEQNRRLATLAEQLGRARIDALSAVKAKQDFLATMSHEIRTPLNGVLGLTQLLLETQLDRDQRDMARTILSSAEILLRMLNDVLDLSKIEAGRMTLEPAPFTPAALAAEAEMLWRGRAADKGLSLEVTAGEGCERIVSGDSVRIRQILFNLISNAIKFTQSGGVQVCISLFDLGHGRIILRGEVRDTGTGVPEALRPRLFQPFMQADSTATRAQGGTGLGLSICKRLTDLFEGTIGYDPCKSGGSRFWFEVPLSPALAVPQSLEAAPGARGPATATRLLVAEDNPVNQEVIARFLALRGWSHDLAETGEDALRALRERRYAAALMDVHMPGMDGLEATRLLRLEENPDARTPVIALTAAAQASDRLACAEAGMDGYVVKPIRRDELFAELDRVLARRGLSARPPLDQAVIRSCAAATGS